MAKIVVAVLAIGPACFIGLLAFIQLRESLHWHPIICAAIPIGLIVWIFSAAFK